MLTITFGEWTRLGPDFETLPTEFRSEEQVLAA